MGLGVAVDFFLDPRGDTEPAAFVRRFSKDLEVLVNLRLWLGSWC
jgi:hypothetical protein